MNPLYNQPYDADLRGHPGVTKFEAFTMAAMQGILSNGNNIVDSDELTERWVSTSAVKLAKATLDALQAEMESFKAQTADGQKSPEGS